MHQPSAKARTTMTAKRKRGRRLGRVQLVLALSIALAQFCGAYSVLTHEEVVDLLWKDDIQPLLVKRFPSATPDDLRKRTRSPTAVRWCRIWATIHSEARISAI